MEFKIEKRTKLSRGEYFLIFGTDTLGKRLFGRYRTMKIAEAKKEELMEKYGVEKI